VDPGSVSGFVTALALGYLAAALLLSGVAHLAWLGAFRAVVSAHAVVPDRAVVPVALLVAVTETGLGAVAAVTAVRGGAPPVLFAAAAVLGVGFVLYLRALLRRPDTGVGCGCTPLPAPLTPASLLPGGMLAGIAILALAATAAGPSGSGTVFPLLWGATFALLVVLVPASVPQPAAEGGA